MLSGFVYFEEIVENIKDITGYENMQPYYDKIRRFIFNCERDIGAGGLIVRKTKTYTIGDGFYDGSVIRMPDDFIGEHSCNKINYGCIEGNTIRLYNKNSPKVTFKYLAYLLDSNGNPLTTRNHLDAVVYYARLRLYASRLNLGTGSQNVYREFKDEYNEQVMASRGEDAFPTEEEWEAIGATLRGGTIEAMTNCGICSIQCCGDHDEDGDPTNIDPLKQTLYHWQFGDLTTDITSAPLIDQVFLDSVESSPMAYFLNGNNVEYTNIGKIGFGILNTHPDIYNIHDSFDVDITSIVFDSYYNEELSLQIFISKEYYTYSNPYFKFRT